MWPSVLFLASVCFVLIYLLVCRSKKYTRLFEDYSELKARQELAAEAVSRQSDVDEDPQARQKPITVDSIRTALRFNGLSPDIPTADDPNVVYFKYEDCLTRIVVDHLPYISIEMGFSLKESKKNMELLREAATEVTASMFVGKAYIVGDNEGLVFSAECICPSYVYLRDHLKDFLHIISDASTRVSETYDKMENQEKEEKEKVFSGDSFVQASTTMHKLLS